MSGKIIRVETANPDREKQRVNRINLYFSTFIVNLAVFGFGGLYAWSSPSLPKLQARDSCLPVDTDQASWVGSLIALGSALGPGLGGWLINHLGRRPSLVLSVAIGMLSLLILYQATVVWELYMARLVAGIGGGVMFTVVPMYVSELAEDEVRSALSSVFNFALMGGMLMVYSVGPYVSFWSLVWILIATFAAFLVTSPCVPESPHFHLQRNQEYKAYNNLNWLRKGVSKEQVVEEVTTIKDAIEESQRQRGSLLELFRSENHIHSLLVACGCMLFQQLSGINVVVFYSQSIFEKAGQSSLSPSESTILVGCVLLLSAAAAIPLTHHFGIRNLLIVSAIGMAVFLGLMGLYFFLLSQGSDTSSFSWLPIVSLLGFVIIYTFGFGPLPWVLSAEVFVPNVKGVASAVTSSFVWAVAFIITKLFPLLADAVGTHSVFWAFSVCCVLAFFFVLYFVPDTRGLSLQEVQDVLAESRLTFKSESRTSFKSANSDT